jgi:hypothetical protein
MSEDKEPEVDATARGSKRVLVKRIKAALLVLNHNLSDEAKLDEVLALGPNKENEAKD